MDEELERRMREEQIFPRRTPDSSDPEPDQYDYDDPLVTQEGLSPEMAYRIRRAIKRGEGHWHSSDGGPGMWIPRD